MNDFPKDAARIERDLAETRARLGYYLDELTRRLSPGQLVDQGVAYLRDGQGAAFARNLGTQVRDNPLPVTLSALGLAWLAASSSMASSTSRSGTGVPYDGEEAQQPTFDDIAARAHRAGEAVARAADETEDAFKARVAEARARVLGLQQDATEAAAAFADRVQQSLDVAQQRASAAYQRVHQTAREWRDDLAARGQRTGEAVSQAAQRGRDFAVRSGSSIADALGDNPLLLGVLGLSAGVMLGMLLPRTSEEEEMIGPAARFTAEKVSAAADEVVERGTRAADAAASAACQAVDRPAS